MKKIEKFISKFEKNVNKYNYVNSIARVIMFTLLSVIGSMVVCLRSMLGKNAIIYLLLMVLLTVIITDIIKFLKVTIISWKESKQTK